MFISKKNKKIKEKIELYLLRVGETFGCFQEGVLHYLRSGRDRHFDTLVLETHQKESDADNICVDIEVDLYAKYLLPESREDILFMLERVDLLPNQCEDVLRQLKIQRIDLPEFIYDDVRELLVVCGKAYGLVVDAVRNVLGKGDDVARLTRLIDNNESLGDSIEQRIVANIFASDFGLAEKMLYRDLVYSLGRICDHAEKVSQFITIFTVKRHV